MAGTSRQSGSRIISTDRFPPRKPGDHPAITSGLARVNIPESVGGPDVGAFPGRHSLHKPSDPLLQLEPEHWTCDDLSDLQLNEFPWAQAGRQNVECMFPPEQLHESKRVGLSPFFQGARYAQPRGYPALCRASAVVA